MYTPPAFQLVDLDRAIAVMRDHPFGQLVMVDADGRPEISHLPLLVDVVDDSVIVRGHVARANPMAHAIAEGRVATAVFTGPHAYVSPDWFGDRDTVPTWNYLAVHATGRLSMLAEPDAVEALLADLSATHEAGLAPKTPWTAGKMSPGTQRRMIKGITAFTLAVDALEAKAKLSQNKTEADRVAIAAQLRHVGGGGSVAVAEWMARV
ncbi:MAG: FMN-binding negative transcriptional regulator [Alphaproteobacteria bacterium]|nr:FMN-binding negative transcriptional regulator [Alphaproteobacteria bacterium]